MSTVAPMRHTWSLGWGVLWILCQSACAVATIEDDSVDDTMTGDDADDGVGAQASGGNVLSGSGGDHPSGGAPAQIGSGGTPGPTNTGGMTAAGGRVGVGPGVGGSVSDSACTNIVPPPNETDWPAGTCQGWASQTPECDSDWMLAGDDGKGWCNRSCGRCSGL